MPRVGQQANTVDRWLSQHHAQQRRGQDRRKCWASSRLGAQKKERAGFQFCLALELNFLPRIPARPDRDPDPHPTPPACVLKGLKDKYLRPLAAWHEVAELQKLREIRSLANGYIKDTSTRVVGSDVFH
jgi:hypothetical protein